MTSKNNNSTTKPPMEINVNKAICVWDYDHLPKYIKEFLKQKAISIDDADWFALKPAIYQDDYIPWLEKPIFGCCFVQEHPIGTIGHTLIVGYHS